MEAKVLCNFPRNINKESVIKCNPLMETIEQMLLDLLLLVYR